MYVVILVCLRFNATVSDPGTPVVTVILGSFLATVDIIGPPPQISHATLLDIENVQLIGLLHNEPTVNSDY